MKINKKIHNFLVAGLISVTAITGTIIQTQYEVNANTTEKIVQIQETGTTKTGLNIRKSSSIKGAKITVIPKGKQVTILNKESNGWYKVKYNEITGYVSGSYITLDSQSTTTDVNKTMQTTANLNVRSGGSTSYSRLTTLKKGTTVIVTSISNGWSKITYNNGKIGYVDSRYLKETTSTHDNSQNNTTNDSTNLNKIMETTANLNVRSGGSTSYSRLTTLKKGTTITVTSISNGWSKITYNNGKIGYVDSRYLKETTSTPNNNQNNTNNGTDLNKTMKTTTGLNVRSGRSTSYSRLTTLAKGTTVTVHNISNGWGEITYGNGKKGYVNVSYLEEIKSVTTPEVKPEVKPEITPETKPEVKPETTPESQYRTIHYSTLYNTLMADDNWEHIEGSPNIIGYKTGELLVTKDIDSDLLDVFGFERATIDNNTAVLFQIVDIITDKSVATGQIINDIFTHSTDYVKDYGIVKLSVIYHPRMVSVTILHK